MAATLSETCRGLVSKKKGREREREEEGRMCVCIGKG